MYQFKGNIEGMDFQGPAKADEAEAYDAAVDMVAAAMGWSFDFTADYINPSLSRFLDGHQV